MRPESPERGDSGRPIDASRHPLRGMKRLRRQMGLTRGPPERYNYYATLNLRWAQTLTRFGLRAFIQSYT